MQSHDAALYFTSDEWPAALAAMQRAGATTYRRYRIDLQHLDAGWTQVSAGEIAQEPTQPHQAAPGGPRQPAA